MNHTNAGRGAAPAKGVTMRIGMDPAGPDTTRSTTADTGGLLATNGIRVCRRRRAIAHRHPVAETPVPRHLLQQS